MTEPFRDASLTQWYAVSIQQGDALDRRPKKSGRNRDEFQREMSSDDHARKRGGHLDGARFHFNDSACTRAVSVVPIRSG